MKKKLEAELTEKCNGSCLKESSCIIVIRIIRIIIINICKYCNKRRRKYTGGMGRV